MIQLIKSLFKSQIKFSGIYAYRITKTNEIEYLPKFNKKG